MPATDIILYAAIALPALAGVWLLVRWVIGDRAKGRRRCPRCWYDLAGVTSETCPECGHALTGARLDRTRRRAWRAVLGLVLILLAAGILWGRSLVNRGWPAAPNAVLAETYRFDLGTPQIDNARDEFLSRVRWREIGVEPITRATGILIDRIDRAATTAQRLDRLQDLASIENRMMYSRSRGDGDPAVGAIRFGDAISDESADVLLRVAQNPDPDVRELAWELIAKASHSSRHARLIPEVLRFVSGDLPNRLEELAAAGGSSMYFQSGDGRPFVLVWPDAESWHRGIAYPLRESPIPERNAESEKQLADAITAIVDAWDAGNDEAFIELLDRTIQVEETDAPDAGRIAARLAFWLRVRLTHDEPGCTRLILNAAELSLNAEPVYDRVSIGGGLLSMQERRYPALLDLSLLALVHTSDDPQAVDLLRRAIGEGTVGEAQPAIKAAELFPDEHLPPLREELIRATTEGYGKPGGAVRGWLSATSSIALRAGVPASELIDRAIKSQMPVHRREFASMIRDIGARHEGAAEILWGDYQDELKARASRENTPGWLRSVTPQRSADDIERMALHYLGSYAVASGEKALVTREVLEQFVSTPPTLQELEAIGTGKTVLGVPSIRGAPVITFFYSQGLDRGTLIEAAETADDPAIRFWSVLALSQLREDPVAQAQIIASKEDTDPVVAKLAELLGQEMGR